MNKVEQIIVPDAKAESGYSPNGQYVFNCPGCGNKHIIHTVSPMHNGAVWSFNGDVDRPTFSPSVNVTCGHYVTGQPQPPDCWHCNEGHKVCYRCHFIITDGNIQFCSDSTHAMAGQSVELPEIKKRFSAMGSNYIATLREEVSLGKTNTKRIEATAMDVDSAIQSFIHFTLVDGQKIMINKNNIKSILLPGKKTNENY